MEPEEIVMKAIVLGANGRMEAVERPRPSPKPHELLVAVKAVSVNPIDFKVRTGLVKAPGIDILGWDASGVVLEAGPVVRGHFSPGDEVYYAGSISKPGTDAEFHVVDAALAGRKPKTLTFPQAAALPLTALTAYEALFEKLEVDFGKTVLIINGGGGVGSMAIQFAHLAGLHVIASASRQETIAWCHRMGARDVVDHHNLVESVKRLGREIHYILNAHNTELYLDACCELLGIDGRICSVLRSEKPISLEGLFAKRLQLSFEYMFAKSLLNSRDRVSQGRILDQVSAWVDEGKIHHTMSVHLNGMTADNFEEAHRMIGSGKSYGKIVIEY
jgi:NADPH2:quinone reductase